MKSISTQTASARSRVGGLLCTIIGISILCGASAAPASAQARKPYDNELMRLSEVLGAVHYLRELCGSGDGQAWRDEMRKLITAEGSDALRRARLSRRFNQGYRSYSRTYNVCTPSAKTAIERFVQEGVNLSDKILKSVP